MSDLFSFDNTENNPQPAQDAADPVAEFLAREQAVLGDNADFLNTLGSGSEVTGTTEPDFGAFGSPSMDQMDRTAQVISPSSAFPDVTPDPNAANLFQSFPDVDSAGNPMYASPSAQDGSPFAESESDFIHGWRQKQVTLIEERDQKSKTTHEETLKKAMQDIDQFYEDYNTKKEQTITHNRANEKFEIQQANTGTPWERVYRQIDLATGGFGNGRPKSKKDSVTAGSTRDTSRFRELIADLRKDPNAPGSLAINS
ncbi:Clathrin light chain [Dispira simplex]|nr:Clathrin light chain [Dispira simplex]